MNLRAGLIGVGPWGINIARTIREDIQDLTLCRAASSNHQSQLHVGDQCQLHKDWREMLVCNDLDAVFLAVPAALNREIASAVLAAGIPVFIEKPVALNSVDAREILAFAIQYKGIAEVDHLDLFNPAIRIMQREIEKPITKIFGRIGASYERRTDMQPLWEYAPHFLALAVILMETMPVAVRANYLPIEVDAPKSSRKEIVRMNLDFDNGVDVCIEAGNGMANKVRSIDVYLEDHGIHFADRASVPLSRFSLLWQNNRVPIIVPSSVLPLTAAIRSFVQKVRLGKPDIAGVVMGLKVVVILEAITKSLLVNDWCVVAPIDY